MISCASVPLFEAADADIVFRRLFCALYGSAEPNVALGRIIHWANVAHGLSASTTALDDCVAHVPSGYFYAPQTAAPVPDQVPSLIEQGGDARADVTLIPVVDRAKAATLRDAKFIELPWFVESRFISEGDVHASLRAQLGGDRYRRLRKQARKADAEYAFSIHWGESAKAWIPTFDRLHRQNLAKYGHRSNHFAPSLVEMLFDSPLGARVGIALQTVRATGEAVQACLLAHDDHARMISLIVHGIDHDRVPRDQNLYASTIYDVYCWGAERGVRVFSLGRGAPNVKASLGANVFRPLANYVFPHQPQWTPQLLQLRALAEAAMQATMASLLQTGNGR